MYYNRLRLIPAQIVDALESKHIPFMNYILTFFAIIILREFLECYSQVENLLDTPYPLWVTTYQNILAYTVMLLPVGILIHYATKETLENVYRVMIPCLLLLFITPLLDLLLTAGEGANILYMEPDKGIDLWYNYLSYVNGYAGISTGIRVEVLVMLFACAIYFYLKNCSLLRSFFFIWAIYTWLFIFACTPIIASVVVEAFNYSYHDFFKPTLVMHFLLFTLFFMFFPVTYLMDKKVFIALMKDMRLARIAYYELSLLFGVSIAFSIQNANIATVLHNHPDIIINVICLMMAVFFALMFCLMINNIYDLKIDAVSNPSRPLVAGSISPSLYNVIAYSLVGIALFYASAVSSRAIFMIALIMSSYYIYSATPLRLKRVLILSKLVISLNSVALIVLGFTTVQLGMLGFPKSLLWVYFLGVTLVANCIDLKDVAGDKADGVITLPILLGDKITKRIIGVAGFALYLSLYLTFNNMMLLPGLVLIGGLFFYLINKQVYQDWKVLMLNNAALLLISTYLLVSV